MTQWSLMLQELTTWRSGAEGPQGSTATGGELAARAIDRILKAVALDEEPSRIAHWTRGLGSHESRDER